MNDQELDLDDLDNLLEDFDGITVEGGTDPENNDDGCEGGACKNLATPFELRRNSVSGSLNPITNHHKF